MKRTFSLLLVALSLYSVTSHAQYWKIMTYAGSGGTGGFAGDGYSAPACLLDGPEGVAVDNAGDVYIVDYYNYRIRKVKTNGTIVTFAGVGTTGYSGDGSYAASASIDPSGVAADFRGNVYISQAAHGLVCKVNKLGIITVYAGDGTWGYSGDGGSATNARLTAPMGLATDLKGNLYIADAGNHCIRKVDTFGVITTVAGSDTAGYQGDGFSAKRARLDSPYAVAVDRQGELYIADRTNNVIRFVDFTGTIYTIAGTGTFGYSGDGAEAISANLAYPTGIAVDTMNFIYIADSYNNVVRVIDTNGIIKTFAGNGSAGFGGDLGAPTGANLYHPYGLATDTAGNLFIADANNQRIRKVYVYDNGLGINEAASATGINAFPNPVTNEINVSGLVKSDNVAIFDLTGRQVSKVWIVGNDGTGVYNVERLNGGLYLLQVTDNTGNKKAVIRFVK